MGRVPSYRYGDITWEILAVRTLGLTSFSGPVIVIISWRVFYAVWLVGIAIRIVNSEALEPRTDIPTSFLVDLCVGIKKKIGTTIAKKKKKGGTSMQPGRRPPRRRRKG